MAGEGEYIHIRCPLFRKWILSPWITARQKNVAQGETLRKRYVKGAERLAMMTMGIAATPTRTAHNNNDDDSDGDDDGEEGGYRR